MSYEVMYKRVRFDSFVKLYEIKKEGDWTGVTIRYYGTDICGEAQIDFGIGVGHKEKDKFLKIASETLKIF